MIPRQVRAALTGTAIAVSVIALYNMFVPVTALMTAQFIEVSETHATARVSGYKIRDVEVVKDSFVGFVFADGEWHETDFDFPKDTSPNSSKPGSFERQSFGLWRWRIDGHGRPSSVKMTVQHKLDPGDPDGEIRLTEVGPFDLPK